VMELHRDHGGFEMPRWLSNLLLPLSWLYCVGLKIYLFSYRIGLRRRFRLPCRVVSVGNLTFGGTGKSPTVRAICEQLKSRDIRTVVVSRGHGGAFSAVGAVVSDGTQRQLGPVDCGDEPAALADVLAGVPIVIGKDRRAAGRLACERFSPDVIVLDDGMQYWQLDRNVEIALVDAAVPFGNGRLLPAGNLREPVSGLRRADVILVTGLESASVEVAASTMGRVCRIAKNSMVLTAKRCVRAVIDWSDKSEIPTNELAEMRLVAVSGIARPASFSMMLKSIGVNVCYELVFGDHCSYTLRQVDSIKRAVFDNDAHAIITTAKDAVKLADKGFRLLVLDIEMKIDGMDKVMDIIADFSAGGSS